MSKPLQYERFQMSLSVQLNIVFFFYGVITAICRLKLLSLFSLELSTLFVLLFIPSFLFSFMVLFSFFCFLKKSNLIFSGVSVNILLLARFLLRTLGFVFLGGAFGNSHTYVLTNGEQHFQQIPQVPSGVSNV